MEGQWQQRGDGEDNGDDSINVEMNTVPSSSGEARARTKDGAQPTRNLASSLGAFVAGVIFCLCAGVVWSHAIAVQSSCQATAASHDDVIRPAVIVVTAMTSEMERWVERLPLGETLPFFYASRRVSRLRPVPEGGADGKRRGALRARARRGQRRQAPEAAVSAVSARCQGVGF